MNSPYPNPPNHDFPPLAEPTPEQRAAGSVRVPFPQVTPLVTYTILIITVLVFLLQIGSEFLLGTDLLAAFGLKSNIQIVDGQVWRLLTPMLLHGSILHIGFNMYALFLFGTGLESHYGHTRFLVLYLLSGFAGNVISFIFSIAPSLGSSTAIFGLLAAEGVFLYQNRTLFGSRAQRALVNIITVAAINLIIGLSPGIDNWGHVGGLLGGVLFAWFGGPKLRVEGIYPVIKIADDRDGGDIFRTTLIEGMFFILLSAFFIYMRRGGI